MAVFRREYKSKKTRKPVWCYVLHHEKKRYKESGFTTCKEAEAAEKAKLIELHSKRAIPQPKEELMVDEFMPVFLEHRRRTKSPNTVVNEKHRSELICREFGSRLMSDITPSDIMDYTDDRQDDGLSNRAVNLELTFLRSFFKYAIKKRVAAYNPAQEVESLPESRNESWIPEMEDFLRFVKAAGGVSTARFLVPWIWFRAFTGTRPRESFFMEWSDVDFENNRITLRPKEGNPLKNRKFRVVDIHPQLRPILLEWKQEWDDIKATWEKRHKKPFPHDWMFMNPKRRHLRAQGYFKSFKRARDVAGLPLMHSYTLRHFFISFCIMSGIDLFTISKWTGHRNTRMIEEVYGHLVPDYRASQMAKLKITPDSDAA